LAKNNVQYGGQAVIEGVMMRGPRFFAVACRRVNKEIVVEQESVESILRKFQWLNKPFLRGTLALIDAMALGIKSLMFSADIAMADIDESDPKKPKRVDTETGDINAASTGNDGGQTTKAKSRSVNDIAISATMVLGVALGFVIAPHLLVGLLGRLIHRSLLLNLAEGIVRICLFVGYVAVISLMKDIRRVFEYHGAEHKVINTFEADLELTPENFAKFTTIHPRCGSSFILVVLILSIVVFSFLGWANVWYERIFSRLLLLPVIAGLGYEVIRFAGRHKESRVLAFILAPGLWLQRLTTREPADDQVEVALCALQAVLVKETATDNQQPAAGN